MEREYQRAINAMDRAALGAFRSTPLGIAMAESKLTPARSRAPGQQTGLFCATTHSEAGRAQ